MMQHHKYSLEDLENMMPWEREVYVGLLIQWLEEEQKRIEAESKRKYRWFRRNYKREVSMNT